jgi:tetratricopeptide (TPR) repeat protein
MTDIDDMLDAAWRARREGRHDEAERGLRDAVDVSRRSGSRLQLIDALKRLAHVLHDARQGEQALPLYEEALALSREEGDALVLAHTVRHLGDLHRGAGRLADAERCYAEALSIYRSAPEPPALDFANALRPAALLKEEQGDTGGARALWSEARAHYDAAGIEPGVEECSRRLARL